MQTIEAQHFVGGVWQGTPTGRRVNPARPDDLVSVSAEADEATVDRALAAAGDAQPAWQAMPAPKRGQVLMRAAALLEDRQAEVATDLTREEGKTLDEAIGEVRRSISILQFFGSEGWRIGGQTFPSASRDVLIYSRREPIGLVLAITPWNFPIAIPTWKIAPALVAGNAVILKPARLTPGTATHLVRALADAGMPPGVLSLVLGTGGTIGSRLIDDPRVSALSFTGSLAVGSQIYERAARRRIRTQLEMGGKNAIVVLDDADPVVAARIAAAGAFGLTGQACTATSRVICQRGVTPALEAALEAESRRFYPGDGLEAGVIMGPVVSEDQLAVDRSFLDAARSGGLRIVTGEEAPRGLFHPPVIISGVKVTDRLAQEEIFGPIMSVISVASLDEAIAAVNTSRYGLVAGIVTSDLAAAQRFARDAHVGVVKVNQPTTGVELNVPFGGVADSSTNTYRELGSAAVDFYTWNKSVYVSDPGWS